MRYICQQRPQQPGIFYYASMHDEGVGIPVYSGYVMNGANVNFQAQAAAAGLRRTTGNVFACTKIEERMRVERINPHMELIPKV